MTSRTGNSPSFTLVEVLVAVAIMSVSVVGVIRAYVVLMNAIETSRFTIEASYLSKLRMGQIELETVENGGISPGTINGRFAQGYESFGWEQQASEVEITEEKKDGTEAEADVRMGPKEVLNSVSLTVTNPYGFKDAKRFGLHTYIGTYPEINR